MIKVNDANATAAAITNLSLMGINAGIGAYTLLWKPSNYGKYRTIHRLIGFALGAASIWLTVSATTSDDITKTDKVISSGYAVTAVVPILLFSF